MPKELLWIVPSSKSCFDVVFNAAVVPPKVQLRHRCGRLILWFPYSTSAGGSSARRQGMDEWLLDLPSCARHQQHSLCKLTNGNIRRMPISAAVATTKSYLPSCVLEVSESTLGKSAQMQHGDVLDHKQDRAKSKSPKHLCSATSWNMPTGS